jgi:glycosyltransferase involved in cell wall biosynthesis
MQTQSRLDSEKAPPFLYTFTVFTPTFNRARTLHRAYDSLCRQTYRNFEWLIVDDGSIDETPELVQQWQQEAAFPIRYHRQSNSGKHVAYNFAAQTALGEFVVNLDSDDACIPEALERFKFHWDQIPVERQPLYSGIDCLCQDTDGKIIGSLFPQSPLDSNCCELRYRLRVTGEKWGCQRTEMLRQFPFPDVRGPKLCVPETIVWNRLTQQYPARYVNEALRVYYTNGTDQITRARWVDQDLTGFWLHYRNVLNFELDYFKYAPISFIKAAALFSRISWHRGYSLETQIVSLSSLWARLLWLGCLPLGLIWWVSDRLKK